MQSRCVWRILHMVAPVSAALLVGIAADPGRTQSFNCRDARHADEVLICQEDRLSQLDEQLADLYARQHQRLDGVQRETLRETQRVWLRQRRECGRDRSCVANLYEDRIKKLTVDVVLPAAVGDCVTTTIAEISDRFGKRLPAAPSPDTMGTGILYSNGGWQVSYSWEAAIARSRVGDKVRMCLASIPKDCPPGDERGRMYTTNNLRTGEAWTLPDAQHKCGGA